MLDDQREMLRRAYAQLLEQRRYDVPNCRVRVVFKRFRLSVLEVHLEDIRKYWNAWFSIRKCGRLARKRKEERELGNCLPIPTYVCEDTYRKQGRSVDDDPFSESNSRRVRFEFRFFGSAQQCRLSSRLENEKKIPSVTIRI